MKKLIGGAVSLIISLMVLAGSAYAQEGSLSMSASNVSCQGISIWRDNSYRVSGRCDGLVYPYATQYDHYVLWAKLGNGTISRVDDIDRGYFEGGVFDEYTSLFITAEQSSSPRKPAAKQIVSGSIAPFDFDKTTAAPVVQPTPVPSTIPSTTTGMTVQQSSTTAATSSAVSGVVSTILKSLLLIVGVIIVVTIVASLLFRRRGSVSA